jgi:hypothetical protein
VQPPLRGRTLARAALVGATLSAIAQGCSSSSPDRTDSPLPQADAATAESSVAAPRGRQRFSETGLFADIASKALASDVLPFEPEFVLWSDGAIKKRWVRLPAGATIDATDPDRWRLPVGTQLFKEFSRDGKRLETRLVERIAATGNDDADYFLGAFLWRDDESDADFVREGASNVRRTNHDVPSAKQCWSCHIGEPGHALGFSALQLSHARPGINLGELRKRGVVPASLVDRAAAGDPTTRAAIGWLHANCGHCHSESGAAWPDTDMTLRLPYGYDDPRATKLVTSTVGVPVRSFTGAGLSFRIASGDPDSSAVLHRLASRERTTAMPPIATEIVDPDGTARVRAWIASLPRDAGAE